MEAADILPRSQLRAEAAARIIRGDRNLPDQEDIIRRLHDRGVQGHTKRELLHLLPQVVRGEGDRKAIMACLSQLGDEDASVRLAAVEALESVIPMRHARSFDGRKEAIMALGRVCVDWNARARTIALRLMVSISDKSDFDVQSAVMGEVLKDSSELPLFARIAAVEAVPFVTRQGDPYAVRQLLQELTDEDPSVRLCTVEALRKLVKRGDPQVDKPLCVLLTDPEEYVTVAALTTLIDTSADGNPTVVKQIADTLAGRRSLAIPAIHTLVAVAHRGDDNALDFLLTKAQDRDASVRLLAVEGIAKIADGERIDVTDLLLSKLNREKLRELRQTQEIGRISLNHHSPRKVGGGSPASPQSGESLLLFSDDKPRTPPEKEGGEKGLPGTFLRGTARANSRIQLFPQPDVSGIRPQHTETPRKQAPPPGGGTTPGAAAGQPSPSKRGVKGGSDADVVDEGSKAGTLVELPYTGNSDAGLHLNSRRKKVWDERPVFRFVDPMASPSSQPPRSRSLNLWSPRTPRASGSPSKPQVLVLDRVRPLAKSARIIPTISGGGGRSAPETGRNGSTLPLSGSAGVGVRPMGGGVRRAQTARSARSPLTGDGRKRGSNSPNSPGSRHSNHRHHDVNMEADPRVRHAVIVALCTISETNDLDVMLFLVDRLRDTEPKCKLQAVITLVKLMDMEKLEAIDPQTDHARTKQAAEFIHSFRAALLVIIEDRNAKMRAAALEGLEVVCQHGDVTAMNKITSLHGSLNSIGVIGFLVRLAPDTNQIAVVDACVHALEHFDPASRPAPTGEPAIKFIVRNLIQAASRITSTSKRTVVQKLLVIANSSTLSPHSHQAALISLHKLATKQERQAISDAIARKTTQAEAPLMQTASQAQEGGAPKPAEEAVSFSAQQKEFMDLISK